MDFISFSELEAREREPRDFISVEAIVIFVSNQVATHEVQQKDVKTNDLVSQQLVIGIVAEAGIKVKVLSVVSTSGVELVKRSELVGI